MEGARVRLLRHPEELVFVGAKTASSRPAGHNHGKGKSTHAEVLGREGRLD